MVMFAAHGNISYLARGEKWHQPILWFIKWTRSFHGRSQWHLKSSETFPGKSVVNCDVEIYLIFPVKIWCKENIIIPSRLKIDYCVNILFPFWKFSRGETIELLKHVVSATELFQNWVTDHSRSLGFSKNTRIQKKVELQCRVKCLTYSVRLNAGSVGWVYSPLSCWGNEAIYIGYPLNLLLVKTTTFI